VKRLFPFSTFVFYFLAPAGGEWMLFKVFGWWKESECRRVCVEVEEVISTHHGQRAMSLAFLDLDSRGGRKQAESHRLKGGGPILLATVEGREVARWDHQESVRAFLRTLLGPDAGRGK